MTPDLTDRVEQGRQAIAIARLQGLDTQVWEEHLNLLVEAEQQLLMAWAAEFAEADVTLATPITYLETSLRPITTAQVSQSIRRYLKTVASAAIHRTTGGWGRFTSEWWEGQANESLGALKALRSAMAEANVGDQS
jgi:hypothetical protein